VAEWYPKKKKNKIQTKVAYGGNGVGGRFIELYFIEMIVDQS
jgi:hypothetical protein